MGSEGMAMLYSKEGEPLTELTGRLPDRRPIWARLGMAGRALIVASEFALILAAWQIAIGVLELVNPIFLPAPVDIVTGMAELVASGELWTNIAFSAVSYAIGFPLAVVVGVLLGSILGAIVPVRILAGPILWSLYATPFLAYRPLSTVWFGFGQAPIIFLVFMAAVFPILFNTAAGMRSVDPSLLNASRIYGSGTVGRYRDVVLPSIFPFVLTGVRQAVNLGFIGLLVAEMTGSPNGIGALIVRKFSVFLTDQAFAVIIVTVVLILFLTQLVDWITRLVAPWHAEQQKAA